MKVIPSLFIVLALLTMSHAVQAQQEPSRTGNPAKVQILSFTEFNKMPAELQKLVKDNPHLYQVKDRPSDVITIVSSVEFQSLPPDKKNFILAHPERYKVETETAASQKTSSSTGTTSGQ
jgi:hypothetical protein